MPVASSASDQGPDLGAAEGLLKIVMAPVNVAGQPINLVNEFRRRGIDASLVQYGSPHKFGYQGDRLVDLRPGRSIVQFKTIRNLLDEHTSFFHFWTRSLFFSDRFKFMAGLDMPLIRQYGRRIVFRFAGEELRLKSTHMKVNPYNAYRYGYDQPIDESERRAFLDFLRENVDVFTVEDPEMQEFWPAARIIPRAIDLAAFPMVGAVNRERPLVVHAPSNPAVKGSQFVRAAIDRLQREGLSFDYQELSGMQHDAAVAIYKLCDVLVDQLHIGWHGVLGVEAMALGKAVICYLREDLVARHGIPVPILNANPDTITDVLRLAISDHELRSEIGGKARRYAEAVHDVTKVAEQMIGIYQALPPPTPAPGPYRTLDYFQHHITELETAASPAITARQARALLNRLREKEKDRLRERALIRRNLRRASRERERYRALDEFDDGELTLRAVRYDALKAKIIDLQDSSRRTVQAYRNELLRRRSEMDASAVRIRRLRQEIAQFARQQTRRAR